MICRKAQANTLFLPEVNSGDRAMATAWKC